jgi:quinone-modifying oxidoreductase subunit QmoC
MAEAVPLIPGAELREQLERSGAGNVSRCYQCATCTSVCNLSTMDHAFPRRQMALAQWGLTEQLAADPALWICHQCADCSERCPRDVRPGDVLAGMRAAVIRSLSFPGFIGSLVSNARVTWPLMVLAPWLFWVVLLVALGYYPVNAENLFGSGHHEYGYAALAPHWLIYAVFFPIAAWVTLAAGIGGARLWRMMGKGVERKGSFLSGLIAVLADVALHRSFSECEAKPSRKTGHFLLFWGFAGAAITSALLIVAIYVQKLPMPLPLTHPYKLLGNISAVALVIGGAQLMINRYGAGRRLVSSNAFDNFFLVLVAVVIGTGVITETVRLAEMPLAAFAIYTLHLGVVMTLFLTFPYSKFAHMVYRTLALVHQRTVSGR